MQLQEHLRVLSNRIGELQDGFWSEREKIDYLNQAQRRVAVSVHTPDHPYMTSMQHRIPVISNAKYYALDIDYLGLGAISHNRDGYPPRQLDPANVTAMRKNYFEYPYDYNYIYYEMRGKTNPFIADGTADSGSTANILVDNSIDANIISAGNIVFNENDNNAYATVTEIAQDRVTLGRWIGGINKAFSYGDKYRIALPERTLHQMWVWPIQDFGQSAVYSGSLVNITPAKDALCNTFDITITELADNWDVDTDLKITIFDETDTEIATASIKGPVVGKRTIQTRNFMLLHTKTYRVAITDPTTRTDNASNITLYATGDDFLEIDYVPYPRKLENLTDICELDEFMWESMYRIGQELAFSKKFPFDPGITALQLQSKDAIAEAKRTLRQRGEHASMDRPQRTLGANPEFDGTTLIDSQSYWG